MPSVWVIREGGYPYPPECPLLVVTLLVESDDHLRWIIIPSMVVVLLNVDHIFVITINSPFNIEVMFWSRNMAVIEVVGNYW